MILIAHRGNTSGRNPEDENKIEYILSALEAGYHAEIDVWKIENQWMLGHDSPDDPVSSSFLEEYHRRLWCHAKNVETLEAMLLQGLICFFHNQDRAVLTSNGYIWNYQGEIPTPERGILVLPETYSITSLVKCAGICSDYIERYR